MKEQRVYKSSSLHKIEKKKLYAIVFFSLNKYKFNAKMKCLINFQSSISFTCILPFFVYVCHKIKVDNVMSRFLSSS